MPNHYWVYSPEFGNAGDPYKIVECLEAENTTKAKGKFVSMQRGRKYEMESFFWNIGSDNPFDGLKVEPCICRHGVCNCDIDGCQIGTKDIYWDYCGTCVKEEERKHLEEKHYALAEDRCTQNHTNDWTVV